MAFDRLVYCLLGCCDLSDAHTDVGQSIDDFLWLRLSQIHTNDGTTDQQDDVENLTIGQLQNLLYDTYGMKECLTIRLLFIHFQRF